jgi:hypothetical protein
MAILGKVAGSMLKDNLLRNGVDLQFDNDLMYYDVSNRRIGINTQLPTTALTVNGSTLTNTIYSNNYYWGNGSPFISSSYGNSNVAAYLPTDSTIIEINANVAAVNAAILSITGIDTSIVANVAAANLAISNLQTNVGLYQIWANAAISSTDANLTAANSAISTLQSQVYSNVNAAAYLTTYTGNINASNLTVENSYLGNFYISNNTITVTNSNGSINLNPLGTGIVSINSNKAVLIPTGTNSDRPDDPQIGMLRFNTISLSVEFWNGVDWIDTSTGGASIVVSDKFTGDGYNTVFNLTQNSTTAGTLVSINGVVQIPDIVYSVSGNVLTLNEAPLSTDVIDARTIVTTSSPISISLGNSYVDFGDTASGYPLNIHVSSADRILVNSNTTKIYNRLTLANVAISDGSNIRLSQNTNTTIDSFPFATYRTAKYIISISDFTNTKYQSNEILLNHNGSIVTISNYSNITTGGTGFVAFTASISGPNVILQANSTSLDSYCKIQPLYVTV